LDVVSSRRVPKHPWLGLPPARCRSSSPSRDQTPPASSCSATRPASTLASPDPRYRRSGIERRGSLRRAPTPTSGLPVRSRASKRRKRRPIPDRPSEATTAHPSSPPASSRSRIAPGDLRTAKASLSPRSEDLVVRAAPSFPKTPSGRNRMLSTPAIERDERTRLDRPVVSRLEHRSALVPPRRHSPSSSASRPHHPE
jgi:hypothetical protein